MPSIVACTQCGQKLQVPDTLLARRFKCAKCGAVLNLDTPPHELDETELVTGERPSGRGLPLDEENEDDDLRERPSRRSARDVRVDARQAHHGGLLLAAGIVGVVFSILSLPFAFMSLCPCCLPFAFGGSLIGLGASIPALWIGLVDLGKMNKGLMNADGRGTTIGGTICGGIGTLLGAVSTLITGIMLLLHIISIATAPPPPTGPVGWPPPPAPATRPFK